jgi:hypothetical protein
VTARHAAAEGGATVALVLGGHGARLVTGWPYEMTMMRALLSCYHKRRCVGHGTGTGIVGSGRQLEGLLCPLEAASLLALLLQAKGGSRMLCITC